MLHFAYGSNMDRAVMRRHARDAEPIGAASLPNYRFIITMDGYASVAPGRGQIVHGVLWRLTARDRLTLDRWESVASGEYRTAMLPVHAAGQCRPALVYVGRSRRPGRPKSGYMGLVLTAAQAWHLPAGYVASLRHWLPARSLGAGARNLREFGWT